MQTQNHTHVMEYFLEWFGFSLNHFPLTRDFERKTKKKRKFSLFLNFISCLLWAYLHYALCWSFSQNSFWKWLIKNNWFCSIWVDSIRERVMWAIKTSLVVRALIKSIFMYHHVRNTVEKLRTNRSSLMFARINFKWKTEKYHKNTPNDWCGLSFEGNFDEKNIKYLSFEGAW